MPVTLAIHGGAHFFGSTNTHRYWYWRLARKTEGRLFSVDYRLSPQFPFPCALHDCLAAYLYLIRPPPGAKHRAVDPARITICGDSAGGTLAVALLCLIRDAGLPAPAGAMLISPWVDLTHSFPSILQNTATDIPPPYGFSIFKPSTLWPPPPPEFRKRAAERRAQDAYRRRAEQGRARARHQGHRRRPRGRARRPDPALRDQRAGALAPLPVSLSLEASLTSVSPSQLAYAYVSPIWQPSLGGLPPLYIQAGDKEVLRDEIVFLAHRAAHPDRYPVRESILKQNAARTEKAKSYPSTKVHLQIYDEVCHDLPLFSFTTPAKYCYRAMASFAKWVTTPAGEQPGAVPSAGMRLPKTIYSGTQPFNRPDYVDNMIRERVSMTGVVRPMEPESEMSMLQLDPEDIGLIKEDAARRY
ncbi:uncharacterized protein RHOBADRAFT_10908, partial [Rhodotorula graminis WP1]